MRKTLVLAFALLFNSLAYGVQASRESVETLFDLSGAESITNSTFDHIDKQVQQALKEALKGETLSAEQQRRSDAVYVRLMAMVRRELNWDVMKPLYVQLYQDTFDQAEIDGVIAYYRSPVGRAFAAKVPALLEKSAKLGGSLLASMTPKIKEAAATVASGNRTTIGTPTCTTMVAPVMPLQAIAQKVTGVVVVRATILKGTVTDVKIMSGPEIFHEPVIAAMKQYRCNYSEVATEAHQEFAFKVETPSSAATSAAKTP